MSALYEPIVDPAKMLARLLPEARELAAGDKVVMRMASGLGRAAQAHYRCDNIVGVSIHRQPGGWYADVLFGRMPDGISNVLGTPVQTPLPSLDAAVASARECLAMIVAQDALPRSPVTDPVFLYRGHEIPLSQDMMTALARVRSDGNGDYVRGRLRDVDAMVLPLGEDWAEVIGEEARRTVMVVSAMALLSGIMRWPEMTPPGEGDGRTSGGSAH